MATVLCVLYYDPVDGYPPSYARDAVPTIERYHDGQATPTARGGQLAGYAGDVWFPQPPPRDRPWRSMPHHGMTPAHLRHQPLRPGALRRRDARDPRVLARRATDPRGVPDRRERHARGRRGALLQRGRRDGRLGGGRPLQERLSPHRGDGRR